MKFRRGIAKLLVAVTIVELVLSSINRNEYVVMAATEEESAVEESEDSTMEDAVEVVGEEVAEETNESTAEEETDNVTGETVDKSLDSTIEESSESQTEEIAESETGKEDSEKEPESQTKEEDSEKEIESETKKEDSEKAVEEESEKTTENADGTAELENVQENALQLLSDDEFCLGTSDIPATLEDANASTKKEYYIDSYQDWLNFQKLSKISALNGLQEYTFSISVNNSSGGEEYYDFTELTENGYDFTGIGTLDNPFRGTITTDYQTPVTLRTDHALFQYLSTKASIDNLTTAPKGSCAGLAANLIVEDSSFRKLNDILISDSGSGISSGENEAAGGLFANVINDTNDAFVLQGTDVTVNAAVTGGIAGGLIGNMTGSVTLVMDGGIKSAPYVEAAGISSIIGGWIGNIDAKKGIVVVSGDTDGVNYDFTGARTTIAGKAGGAFGKISNATIKTETKLTFKKSTTGSAYELSGITAGSFAGMIEDSEILISKEIRIDQVRIKQGNSFSVTTDKGIGGFAGVLKNTSIDSENGGRIYITGVYVQNGSGTSIAHNIGGIAGYANNSDFLFSQAECIVNNFTVENAYGNVAGAIGLYEEKVTNGTEDAEAVIQRISVTGITTAAAFNGNAAGLIAKMDLVDCAAKVENCYTENLTYAANKMSLGIGEVCGNDSNAKLSITKLVVNGKLVRISGGSDNPTFGGMIAYADIDLEIKGTVNDAGKFDTACQYFFNEVGQWCANIGGLVGIMAQSGTNNREVDISDVLVGTSSYDWFGRCSVYGGLFAQVEEKIAVCLDGKIHMNSGTALNWEATEISVGKLRHYSNDITYFGSVVGSQNYSLIYLQPKAELVISDTYVIDEIGNYGGIYRNGNWDNGTVGNDGNWTPTKGDDASTWLIQKDSNGKTFISGEWELLSDRENPVFKIDTIGDFMRLAIFGNTYYTDGNGFFPLTVTSKDTVSNVTVKDMLVKGDFSIQPGIYDLTETGIDSLYRNDRLGVHGPGQTYLDNEGYARVATGRACNSFINAGSAGETVTIKYNLEACNHPYIGLFPYIDGAGTKKIEFARINFDYTITVKKATNEGSELDIAGEQNIGGLAGRATNDLSITDATYNGVIKDETQNDNSGKNYKKYIGGVLGAYDEVSDKTLEINHLQETFKCDYWCKNDRVGGLIALVSSPSSGRGTINIDDVELQGYIQVWHKYNGVALEMGGLIAHVYKYGNNGLYTNLKISNISIHNFFMKSFNNTTFTSTGGFLGYSWDCSNVSLSNIIVGKADGTDVTQLQVLTNNGIGGLVHDVTGRMEVSDMTYEASTQINNGASGGQGKSNVGLLIYDGRNLYLDIAKYTIKDGVSLQYNIGTYFDELVALNKGGDSDKKGGIVNIHTTDSDDTGRDFYLGRNKAAYSSYVYGTHVKDEKGNYIQKKNPNTRYYYDLDLLDYTVDYVTIDSAEDLMVWHIMHYANSFVINYCLGVTPKYAASNIPSGYTIKGNIDMSGYSIYPTNLVQYESYTATTGAKITFNAQGIYDGEKEVSTVNNNVVVKYPNDKNCQHYQMQQGLFYNIISGVNVTGLTVTGTYSISDTNSAGALVCGTIYGVKDGTDSQGETLYKEDIESTFNNIVFDDLWCVSETGKLNDADASTSVLSNPIALMIYNVSSGAKVAMDGIYMKNYNDNDVEQRYKAASALIGNVGDEEATYISLTFKNMDVMDAVTGTANASLNSVTGEEALARASFIYNYDYKENCSAIYTFTSKDYLVGKLKVTQPNNYDGTGAVTLGEELGNQSAELVSPSKDANGNYALILYYDNEDPVGKASEWLNDDGTITPLTVSEIPFNCYNYIPYVYSTKQDILVNPKIADINKGCGTYEDPYIISSATQLITVYRYLYEEELYKEILGLKGNEWKLHATGDDTYKCNGTKESMSDDSRGHGELISYEQERSSGSLFPTKAQLSQAYYLITADIDLSQYSEFVGFGRAEMPFIGVFVGQSGNYINGTVPTITMVEQSSDSSSLSQYGFIQIAKGVVVKDLTIMFQSSVNIDSETGGIAGGVIASVVGGDNIIENVTVKSADGAAGCFSVKKEAAVVGGYVGVVELGGVILRKITAQSLSGFSVSTTNSLADYAYLGTIIGRVLDGYVVCEDQDSGQIPLFKNTTIGRGLTSQSLLQSLCSTYDIINGAYLKSSNSYIYWTGTGYKIADAQQLQIISMALNSGMLNYNAKVYLKSYYYGYAFDSRQRNGEYSCVGKPSDGRFQTAYNDVISGDNKDTFADSYLCQFFADNTETTEKSEFLKEANNNSALNPISATSSNMLTYTLTGTEYDMSVFGMGFRGLGARYHSNYYYTESSKIYNLDTTLLFKSNFVGENTVEGAHITLDMKLSKAMDSSRSGLLNEVPNTSRYNKDEILIQNIILSGEVKNEGLDITQSKSGYYTNNVYYNAGGFMSYTYNKTKFVNVKLENLTVDATGNAGGLIGLVTDSNACNFYAESIQLNNLEVIGGYDEVEDGVWGGYAGGLIGRFKSINRGTPIYIGTSNGTDATSGVTGEGVTVCSRGRNTAVGGIVGYIDPSSYGNSYIYNTQLINLSVYTKNAYQDNNNVADVGGIIGYAGETYVYLNNVAIGSSDDNGSVEIAQKGENIAKGEEDIVVECRNTGTGVGGFVGRYYGNAAYTTIESCSILGKLTCAGASNTVVRGFSSVGGLIGYEDQDSADISDVTIQGVRIKGIIRAGGCAGYVKAKGNFSMTAVTVSECQLELGNPINNGKDIASASGDIGGLIATGVYGDWNAYIVIQGCKVEDSYIASDYCVNAGGYIGTTTSRVNILDHVDEQTGQAISNNITGNVITGGIAGGVYGKYQASNRSTGMKNITISNNRIVACVCQDTPGRSGNIRALAGGFVAENIGALSPVDNLTIEDNLIAVSNAGNLSYIGGVVGISNANNTCFYNTKLSNNYVGILEDGELMINVKYAWCIPNDSLTKDSKKLNYYLKNTSLDNIREKLYARTTYSLQVSDSALIKVSSLSNVSEDDMYQYSYGMGTVAGKLVSWATTSVNSFVGLNIHYDDNTYRPVSDVGMTEAVSSMQDVYEKYRAQYFIVYDSMNTEKEVEEKNYAGFANLELIYNDYVKTNNEDSEDTNKVDPRYAYRLDDNYLAGIFTDDVNINTIYEESYKNEHGYISDFVTADNATLPLVVFRTTDNGSLDDVIQTYINILTNNSGALNTYGIQKIEVSTKRMALANGVIYYGTDPAAVQVTETEDNKFKFVNETTDEDGNTVRLYDAMTDAKNVTFSLITISYMYEDTVKWVLEIPVYVEQELEFDSHMRLVQGIEYNVNTVKKGEYYNEGNKKLTGLDRGDSYTLYLEYIYGEARGRYQNAYVPKQISMKSAEQEREVSFFKGTQMTLIDLEHGGKPYYYVVQESGGNAIDFTDFVDSSGSLYEVKNINNCTEYVDESFVDVCGEKNSNVAVESYLLLVDTSQVEKEERETRKNVVYSLYTDFSEMGETDPRLYSRIEYTEHCYVKVNETLGLTCGFTNTFDCPYLDGQITEGGNVALTMQYNVNMSAAWKSANQNKHVYLDLGVSLQKTVNNSTQTVALPAGTQVYFEILNDDSTYTRLDSVHVVQGKGTSDVYYYADSDQVMDLIELNAKTDYSKTVRIILDFSTADMSSFENVGDEAEYGISAELLIGTDKVNPGSGEVRDSFYRTVKVDVDSELGFAVQPVELLDQGINRYQSDDSNSGIISFNAKIAFPEGSDQAAIKAKNYGIVYKIEKKTKKREQIEAPVYELYTGTDITIYKGSNTTTGGLTPIEKDGITYRYCTLSSEDLTIEDNVAQILFTLKAGDDIDFSNYRVTGYLIIADGEIIDPVTTVLKDNSDLNSDFFVYTIAKVKTDLN